MPIAITPPTSPVPPIRGRRHILYIDAYDSFSNSIVGLLEQSLGVDVTTVRIDDEQASRHLHTILQAFDAVVVGPGPGHPANPTDVGLIRQLWKLEEAHLLPIFGICLGFQSLALFHGAEIKRLRQARHGIVSHITHNGTDIFENITNLRATQYHSLYVDMSSNDLHARSYTHSCWQTTSTCPELLPLAWDNGDELNGPILMSIRHAEKPFWGVQFHPESICTSREGAELIHNWWQQAKRWLAARHRRTTRERVSILRHISKKTASASTLKKNRKTTDSLPGLEILSAGLAQMTHPVTGTGPPQLLWAKHAGPIDPIHLVDALGLDKDEVVLLDSQGHTMGRYSILGLVIPDVTVKVTYRSWDRTLRYGTNGSNVRVAQLGSIDHVWPMLQQALDIHNLRERSSHNGHNLYADHWMSGEPMPADCPFWGGFMGYISYEAGLETIDVDLHTSAASSQQPDVNFAFVHRSIVIDHATGQTYVQSLSPVDRPWIAEVGNLIDSLIQDAELSEPSARRHKETRQTSSELQQDQELEQRLEASKIETPQERCYRNKVLECQRSLAAGDSYELCLTDETLIQVPYLDSKGIDPWTLYKKLRRKNPAPFGAFLRLSSATVVGTSPERFLQWSRSGHCEFRPIKGTVKKSPSMTCETALGILNSSKEQAENLMIVDLIRHDLSGVIGAEKCSVSKLMTVEEYEHVYQLVSVIEGQLPASDDGTGPSGLDVLKASLPPGSMTGAPKKRSCEILRDIEKRPRGIYSGVLGYLDVGGGGDFSVVIRTATRDASSTNDPVSSPWTGGSSNDHTSWDSSRPCSPDPLAATTYHCAAEQTETWRIGAGGAVTIQSTDEGEYLEMETKVMTALTAFQSA